MSFLESPVMRPLVSESSPVVLLLLILLWLGLLRPVSSSITVMMLWHAFPDIGVEINSKSQKMRRRWRLRLRLSLLMLMIPSAVGILYFGILRVLR